MTRLNALQGDFLQAWFGQTDSFFLTGGAALIAFHDLPRQTDDIDLFTAQENAFPDAPRVVDQTCRSIGAEFEAVRTSPAFRRYRIQRGDEATLVDLMYDAAPQIHTKKEMHINGLVVDPVDEILVNKLCALVGRSAPRDFFDVWYLSTQGHDIDTALERATVKDGGVTPEALVFVLQGMHWDHFRIPGIQEEQVRATRNYFHRWCHDLALKLYPNS